VEQEGGAFGFAEAQSLSFHSILRRMKHFR